MEEKFYNSACGSICLLCGESLVLLPNGYGDGIFKCYLYEDGHEFEQVRKDNYKFFTSGEFKNAYVLVYDCIKLNNIKKEDIIFSLNGRYSFFQDDGIIHIVKW